MFGTPAIIRPSASVSVGVVGPKGSSLIGAQRTPTSTDGYDGDFYIDLTASDVRLYGPKASGAWPTSYLSLVGPQGAPGPQILSGGGAPTSAIGNNNDYYIDTAASALYGPKTTGAWPTPGTSLLGNTGAAGPANTLTVGSVTPLAPGATPTVTITGTPPNQSVSFGIPAGQPGANGTGAGTVIGPSGTNPTKAGQTAVYTDATGTNIGAATPATMADANLTVSAPTRLVLIGTAFTAPRTLTLPAASTYGAGTPLRITDMVGAISTANTLTIAASGSDTVGGAASQTFGSTRTDIDLICDGVSKWTYDVQGIARGGTGVSAPSGTALDNITGFSGTGLLSRTGAGAYSFVSAASFPVSGITAKSSAYTILTTDKGTMFDLTGSFALTLPAASGGTSSAPLYYHFRKRDGSGRCTVVPAGTDTIEGANTAIALYQERVTLMSFGSGWVFPPGGREKVVYVVAPGTAFSAVSLIGTTNGFDADVAEVEFDLENVTSSASTNIYSQFWQNGAYVTSGYTCVGPDSGGSTYGMTAIKGSSSAAPLSTNPVTSANPMIAVLTLRHIQLSTGNVGSVESRGIIAGSSPSASAAFNIRSTSGAAYPISGYKFYPTSGTMSGVYSQKITRS